MDDLFPNFSSFAERYENGAPQVLTSRLVSDLETPVSAFLKLAGDGTNAFLLESVEGGEQLGRYSIIGMAPDAVWRAKGDKAELNLHAATKPDTFVAETQPPLESLKAFVDASRIDLPEDAPPMSAGVFGYLGYDLVRQVEHLPNRPTAYTDIPDAVMVRPTLIAVFDNIRQEISLVATARPTASQSAQTAYDAAAARIKDARARLAGPLPQSDGVAPSVEAASAEAAAAKGLAENGPTSNMEKARFFDMVDKAKDHIRAGDIFQVVLSQRFETPFTAAPFTLYRSLRRTNPSPFLFYLNFDDLALVGSSPEILVRVRKGEVSIRPIAGTRRRGRNAAEDAALAEELLADPKERAEHLMLLDLGRNDVGRSAEIGSVNVTEEFIIERYSHVMHIVSHVVGDLRSDIHPVDAVGAGFPAGTVSGAPKIRAMEIIDDLEHDGRGAYGGAIGYFSADGDVDTCIALRTAMVKDGVMYVQAGAGIVADSDPSSEHEECVNKARALFAAAEAALKR
ncbi:MAG: anthranilate synthase component I [Pseudomonadota bacterium]